MLAIEFITLLLAAWRVSRLISDVSEGGPFDIMHKIRHLAGVRYTPESVAYGTNELSKAMVCIKCTSIWTGLIMSGLWVISPAYVSFAYLPFAVSGAVLFLEEG